MKLGTDFCNKVNGKLEIHVPAKYTTERPAITFSHATFDAGIEEHPLASRLPAKTGEGPSIQEDFLTFRSFSVPFELPILEDYLTTEKPLISLRITSFTDATLVSITAPHVILDAMGMAELVKAWSNALANRYHCIPAVGGAREDAIEAVGTSFDEKAQGPYVLENKQIKGFAMMIFVVRFVWDLLTKTMQPRTIFLPAKFMSRLRDTAEEQLRLDPNSESPSPFLSDGDLITAWCSRNIILSRSEKRSALIMNNIDIRSRLDKTFSSGASYLGNLYFPASTLFLAGEVLKVSFGQMALRLRQAIVEQSSDTQIRSLVRTTKSSYESTGHLPLFGNADTMVMVSSNWSKARFREAANFGPAVISSAVRANSNLQPPGTCVFYWGGLIGSTDSLRDLFFIYGKDDQENYWLQGHLRPETWHRIQSEFDQFI